MLPSCLHWGLDEDSMRSASVFLLLVCFFIPSLLRRVSNASESFEPASVIEWGWWGKLDSSFFFCYCFRAMSHEFFASVIPCGWRDKLTHCSGALHQVCCCCFSFCFFLDFCSYIKKTSISFLIFFFHIFDKFQLSPEHPDWHNDIILSFNPHNMSFIRFPWVFFLSRQLHADSRVFRFENHLLNFSFVVPLF